MNKSILIFVLASIFLIGFASSIDITNCTDLQAMENDLTANYTLINNIDCSDTINWNGGAGFMPIAYASSYTGTFDGQGFNVSNLYINASTGYYGAGLFASTASATIKNVGIINGTVINYNSGESGLLAGSNDESNFSNCFSTGSVSTFNEGISGTGGLLGYFNGITGDGKGIFNSYSTASVYVLGDYAGGLVGTCEKTTIQNCYATGNVRGKDWSGGLFGYSSSNIDSSYSTGNVQGNQYVGGLLGEGYYDEFTPIIKDSYATGNVNGSNYVAGLIGNAFDVNINNSYSVGYVTGIDSIVCGFVAGGVFGEEHTQTFNSFYDNETSGFSGCINNQGTPISTAEMQTESTFTDAGWDFNNTWQIATSQYPTLQVFGLLEEEEPPVEEPAPQVQGVVYQTIVESGAGLGIFMQLMSRALPVLLIMLALVGVIIAVAWSIKEVVIKAGS